jgi:hypothetical protein
LNSTKIFSKRKESCTLSSKIRRVDLSYSFWRIS